MSIAGLPISIDQLIKLISTALPKQEESKCNGFLKIEGIKSESNHEGHKEEIEVLDYRWSVAYPRSASSLSGLGETARAHFGDLTVYKAIDKSSPELAQACAKGRRFDSARFQLCRAGGDTEPYMEYVLTDVIITSVRTGGRGYGENLPLEEVSLSYGKIQWKYIQTRVESGKAAGFVTKTWDLQGNKE
jgi:type VI secretion system secreted protein Hcp